MTTILICVLSFQSKHAEKLLEINQTMLERDKAMKLELDVANSLNSDMTLRLAMNQRTMKALNEKVAALEAAEVQARQKHEAQLREKAEALIQVEARMNNVSKKARSENSKMVCTAFFTSACATVSSSCIIC
jgi:septal ring factor EnvC (AmiA/AmiB activator)